MFFKDTIVPVTYYEYKFLVEIACSMRGYSYKVKGAIRGSAVPNPGLEAETCRFVYQTLRKLPISKLYYETETPKEHSEREILNAIVKLYSRSMIPLQVIFEKYGLIADEVSWERADQYITVLEDGLMDVILRDVNEMLPRIFDGEPVLSIYAKIPKLRQGLRNRYRNRNPQDTKDNPDLLDYLEADFCEWCGGMNIDPDRVDAYVAESVIGMYMGNYFFPHWETTKLKEYTGGRQRVMFEGSILDVSNTESIALKEDPHIDFQQTMEDMLRLSVIMFRHSTAKSKNSNFIDLQYSVLEWYIDMYFDQALQLLNLYYKYISQGKYDMLEKTKLSSSKAPNILQLSTEYKVNRVPASTVDNTLLARIDNNKTFLTMIYRIYGNIDLSNITGYINRHAFRYEAGMSRSKTDSNYPFFKDKVDIINGQDIKDGSQEMQLLMAMFPSLKPDPTTGQLTIEDITKLTSQKQGYVVTDEGYEKFALLVKTLKELDDLNEFLLNHGMSMADLNSVNYLTNEYYAIISDLDGVLYDRLANVWNQEHPRSNEDPYTDGIPTETVRFKSNAEVKEFLTSRKDDYSPSSVNLQDISQFRVTRKVDLQNEAASIQLLKSTAPKNFALDREANYALLRIAMQFHEEKLTSDTVTKFDIYSRDANLVQSIWNETLRFMETFSMKRLACMMGDFVTLLYVQDRMTGSKSKQHEEIIRALESISPTFRYNVVTLMNQLIERKQPIAYLNLSEQMGSMINRTRYGDQESPRFNFAFEELEITSTKFMHRGMVIGSAGVRKVVDAIRMKYTKVDGFDMRIAGIERKFGENTLSLTALCLAYFKIAYTVTDCYLRMFLPVDAAYIYGNHSAVNDFWAQKDKLLAKKYSLSLIQKISEDYVHRINQALKIYNLQQSNPSAKYRTYSSFAIISMLGITQDLKRLISNLSQVYQELKSGAPEQEFLSRLDALNVEYPKNSKAAYRMDESYNRMLYHIVLVGACEWFQSTQMLLDVNKVCDDILKVKNDLKKNLHLEKSTSKNYDMDDDYKLIASRLKQIMETPQSDLANRYRAMIIAAGNRRDIDNKIQQICGSPASMIPTDKYGFLKNPDGQYYTCRISEDERAFIKSDGIVFVCNLVVDNTIESKDAVKFFLITELDDNLNWS